MDQLEYAFIKREVLRLTGVDLNYYKAPQVQRRLRTHLLRSGHTTWRKFFHAAQDDPVVLGKLKDYLTINVSSFFRDPKKFAYLRESIVPELMHGHSKLRVWSAGCSRGHEPYSLAIMLAEVTGPYRRHQILATDIDQSALKWARAGGPYPAEDVENVPPTLLSRYFKVQEDGYWVAENVRRWITFRHHNLLADPFESGLDLIICRNVVIYFTAEVKKQLYNHFHDALRPGGVLFVGGTEIVPQASNIGFESAGFSFYRRNGAEHRLSK
ncbi:MAG: protein-glutamate O-methyltransferase CheR [Chloroflexota bacterium]|nr:protein-glutamate O-methyltransferase CheR [Chloroflexota bacterium]